MLFNKYSAWWTVGLLWLLLFPLLAIDWYPRWLLRSLWRSWSGPYVWLTDKITNLSFICHVASWWCCAANGLSSVWVGGWLGLGCVRLGNWKSISTPPTFCHKWQMWKMMMMMMICLWQQSRIICIPGECGWVRDCLYQFITKPAHEILLSWPYVINSTEKTFELLISETTIPKLTLSTE